LLSKELAKSPFLCFFKIRSIVHVSCIYPLSEGDAAFMRIPNPYSIPRRNDSKTFQITLAHTSGLPEHVCAEWRRRSFQDLPEELAPYRYPKTEPEAKAGAVALIVYLKRKQAEGGARRSRAEDITVGEFAGDMFTEGASHLARWAAKGKVLKPQTIAQHRRHLVNYLLPKFGKCALEKIRPAQVEDFLLEQKLSNSCRNTILYTLKLVMKEAMREGIIDMAPEFEPFKRSSKRQNVLSGEELDALFPDDEKELIRIWKRPDDMRKERDEIALMFGPLFCVAVSAGMRSGEIRALQQEQISTADSGFVIDRAVDDLGQIGPLKKAAGEDPRSRAVLIPTITLKMLERWLDRTPECPDYPGMVFSY
jgi:integrase